MPTLPDVTLRCGQVVHGFEVKAVTALPQLRAVAYQLRHEASGARVLHLHTNDAENLFSISFPTLPPDNTGVPHILEHSVLAGSRKFPVREPFFEMLKMSMATFLNAMTGGDATYYPVASNVRQDLFNLAEVYFDAVFHPLLTEQTFLREGHHLAPAKSEEPLGDLTINGIVFNEMKGAYSHPESILYRETTRQLLPDTVYARDSGGDPRYVHDLTYDGLKRFHETYYQPGNAYFYLYGDIATEDYLAFLDERLASLQRRDVSPAIAPQPRWTQPRVAEIGYPVGRDDATTEKTYLAVDWLTGSAVDPEESTLFHVLGLILLGNEGAPLKKALVDSHLGQDLIYSGSMDIGRELAFRVGLKGSEPGRRDAFEKVVLDTLAGIAARPIEPARIRAAFHQAAYEYLEILPSYPLHTMDRVVRIWLYGADPLTFLRMNEVLSKCRHAGEADPCLFNRLIRERLLDNPHRLSVVLRPDPDMQGRTDAEFAARMRALAGRLSEPEKRQIAGRAAELDRESGTPNSPEQLARLPQLKVADLPAKPEHIPTSVERVGDMDVLRADVFANGVSYLRLQADLQDLPAELWPLLPRYVDAIGKLGAAGMTYEALAQRKAATTGGVGCWPMLTGHAVSVGRLVAGMRYSMKTLDDQIEDALGVLEALLFSVDPRDRTRLQDVVTQAYTANRTNLVYSGSRTAALHAARGLTPQGHLAEIISGLPQLGLTADLQAHFDARCDALMGGSETIRDYLLRRTRWSLSFTGSDAAYAKVRRAAARWGERVKGPTEPSGPVEFRPDPQPPREGLAGPVQVAHCVQVFPAPHFSHPDEPLLALGSHMVSMDYLLSEVRLKGNAYGAWFRYDALGRAMQLGSYSDPHITRTLGVFAGLPDYVRKVEWTQTDIDRAIIAMAKDDEPPIRPESATDIVLTRHVIGYTPEMRERRSARMRQATPATTRRALLAAIEPNLARSAVCVMSNREKLEAANGELGDSPLVIEDILKE